MYITELNGKNSAVVSKLDREGSILDQYQVTLPKSCSCASGKYRDKKCKHIKIVERLTSTAKFTKKTALHLIEELKAKLASCGATEILHYDTIYSKKDPTKVVGVKLGCMWNNPLSFEWEFKGRYNGLWVKVTNVFEPLLEPLPGKNIQTRKKRQGSRRGKSPGRDRKNHNSPASHKGNPKG